MNKIDEFKEFVKNNSNLVSYVRDGKKTWQELYELYDIYGEDKNIWDKYMKESSNIRNSNNFDELFNMAKNIDVDKLQNGITSLQKAISLFGELFINNNSNNFDNIYQPRPLYRKFDD